VNGMNEVTVQKVAFGHWEVTTRNVDTGKLGVALFAAWEEDEANRYAEKKSANTEYLQ